MALDAALSSSLVKQRIQYCRIISVVNLRGKELYPTFDQKLFICLKASLHFHIARSVNSIISPNAIHNKQKERETSMSESIKQSHHSEDNSVTSIESGDTGVGMNSNIKSRSLGSGYISKSGRVSFHAAPTPTPTRSIPSQHEHACCTQQENSKVKRPSSTKKRLSKILSAEKILSPVRDSLSSTAPIFRQATAASSQV